MYNQKRAMVFIILIVVVSFACYSTKEREKLVFSPDQLPAVEKGEYYEVTISISQTETPVGEFRISEGELPPGLVLEQDPADSNKATISGIATESGNYFFTIYVWCYGTSRNGQTGEMQYSIEVR